jgi:hypothetical protein
LEPKIEALEKEEEEEEEEEVDIKKQENKSFLTFV